MSVPRRQFLKAAAGLAATRGIVAATARADDAPPVVKRDAKSVIIASETGERAITKAAELLKAKTDMLDAVISGVNALENDPSEVTAGYGGIPNSDGVVELDAVVMDGRTMKSGAVGALRNVRKASSVARAVMERSDRTMILVGEGALKFAKSQGFKSEELLTERSRKIYRYWKENALGEGGDWKDPGDDADADVRWFIRNYGRAWDRRRCGALHCAAKDEAGNFVAATSTSGLFFKTPGRLGHAAMIGAGLYVDNEIGSCGVTGWGEPSIHACAAHSVIALMRNGMGAMEAAIKTLEQMATIVKDRKLLDAKGLPTQNVALHLIDKDGFTAGASFYSGARYWVWDGAAVRREECAFLYRRG